MSLQAHSLRLRLARLVPIVALVLAACRTPGLAPADFPLLPPPQQAPGQRRLVVISDLHMGLGHLGPDPAAPQAPWDPYEDFRWADAFGPFLQLLDRDGAGRTDLILNGDTFELWQSRLGDCDSDLPDEGCAPQEALRRLASVVAAHRRELLALGAFARSGDNRVVLVPGNHDDMLLFPQVAAAALAAMEAPGRVLVADAGYFRSRDGKIYVEHGHQLDSDANYIRGWPRPFLPAGPSGPGPVLRRPWGEQFVRVMLDPLEDKYPICDNVFPTEQALRFGMSAEGVDGTIRVVLRLADLTLHRTTCGQLRDLWAGRRSLWGRVTAPRIWDLAAVRLQGDRFLVETVPAENPLRAVLARRMRRGSLAVHLKGLPDVVLAGLCARRQAAYELALAQHKSPTVVPCPLAGPVGKQRARRGPLRAARARTVLQDYLGALRAALQRRGEATAQPFLLYIFSHTHQAVPPTPVWLPDWQPLAVNTGAWQRVCSGDWLEQERVARGLARKDAYREVTVEDLPDCYNFVTVEPYGGGPPVPVLRAYRRGAAGYRAGWGTCLTP